MATEPCSRRSRRWVHRAALAGATITIIPIPGTSSSVLALLEMYMVSEICKIYRHEGIQEIVVVLGVEAVASPALKALSELLIAAGPAGWLVRPAIASGFIELLGNSIIAILEKRYPGRLYEFDADVEAGPKWPWSK